MLDAAFDEAAAQEGHADFEYGEQILMLYHLANALERDRGKAENRVQRRDYSFYVEDGKVQIEPRKRGSPVDKVVSELMILVNGEWGRSLAEAGLPGMFRTQAGGKVKMSTVAAPHEGLGVSQYLWASSPLRRYADLVNQRQLVSVLRGAEPAFAPRDQELFEIMREFELAYDAYAEFQRTMERYWCLRWLMQEQVSELVAEVIRDDLVRFERLPLVCRAQSLPSLSSGTRIEVTVSDVDMLSLGLRCEHKKTLEPDEITT
jgi:exoribonuclease-2